MLKLRLLTGPRAGRQLRVSDTKPISIGRRKGRLRLHDSRVSKNHAEIFFKNDLWLLRDLDSANGTYVNRKKAQGLVELEPGDMVQMGRVLFKIVRCDGIGMDTQPAITDELFAEDDALGIAAATAEPSVGEDDFDLDALFSEEDEDALDDGLDQLPSVDEPELDEAPSEPAPSAADSEAKADAEDAIDEDIPEPITVGFDQPVDDDDSFFADLGEATDTSDGIDVAVQQELAEDGAEQEADPFLGDEEASPTDEDTSDQISLEDESGMGPRSAGTTLLTSIPHDDLVPDDAGASSGSFFGDDAVAEADEDDEAPAVVGLHLDQAPPQQPESKAQTQEVVPEVETELDEAADEPTPVEPADEAFTDEADGQKETLEDQLEHDDDLDEPALSELMEGSDLEEPDLEEPQDETAVEAHEAILPPAIAEVLDADAEPEFEDAADALEAELDELIDPEPAVEDAPEPAAALDASESDATEEPGFDIDAAFEELSAGLEDSQELPAIQEELQADVDTPLDDDDAPDGPDHAAQVDQPDTADALLGSQLDVDFIKDALSKLEEGETAQPEPPTDDTQPKASAAPVPPPPTMPPAASPGDSYLQTPPGLNPLSVNPPSEPRRSYPPRASGASKGRWFLSILLLLSVGGVGGWLISQNYDKLIAGRDDTGPANPVSPDPSAPPAGPVVEPAQPGVGPDDPTNPIADTSPTEDDNQTQTRGPDPFAAGPIVLGPDALQGLTSSPDPNRPLDAPQQPTVGNPLEPGTIIQPPLGPGTTNPNDAPATDNPLPNPSGNDDPIAPADAPPARIVFLIDASGSLVDSLPQMVVWLNEALQTIEPDERFAVYFFKSDEPIAIKPQGMLAPSRDVLNQLREQWLDPDAVPVFPSGRSNPAKAIAQAMTHNPTDLYLLSDDAIAMHKGGGTTAEQSIDLVKQSVGESDVRVHGVQFFYRGERNVLETLANQTKGTFEFVRERVVPDGDPIDLLEELEGE